MFEYSLFDKNQINKDLKYYKEDDVTLDLENSSFDEIKSKLDKGINIKTKKKTCNICNGYLNILKICTIGEYDIIFAFCKHCGQYVKYYRLKRQYSIIKEEYYFENQKEPKLLEKIGFRIIKNIELVLLLQVSFILGFFLSLILIAHINLSVIIFDICLLIGFIIPFFIYNYGIKKEKDYSRFLYLSKFKYIKNNVLSYYNCNYKSKIIEQYSNEFLVLQRTFIELLFLLRVYNNIQINIKKSIDICSNEIISKLKESEKEAKLKYINLYDLKNEYTRIQSMILEIEGEINNISIKLDNEYKNNKEYLYDKEFHKKVYLKDNLQREEIIEGFENFKNEQSLSLEDLFKID